MRQLLKTVLIVGGSGLAVWWFMRGRQTPAQPSGQQPSQPGPASTAASTATRDLVRAAVIKAGYPADVRLTHDQWNYFYHQVRGVYGPDWQTLFPERTGDYLFNLEEWWSAASQHGLSGLKPLRDPAFEAWGLRV